MTTLGSFGNEAGHGEFAIDLTADGFDVRPNGDRLLDLPIRFEGFGLDGEDGLGSSFQVYASSTGLSGDGGFLLDDLLVYQTAPIPEPSNLGLLGASALTLLRRTHQQS